MSNFILNPDQILASTVAHHKNSTVEMEQCFPCAYSEHATSCIHLVTFLYRKRIPPIHEYALYHILLWLCLIQQYEVEGMTAAFRI